MNDENALNRLRGEGLLDELCFSLDLPGDTYTDGRDRTRHLAQRDDVVCPIEQEVDLKSFHVSGRRTEVRAEGEVHAREPKDGGNMSCVLNAEALECRAAPGMETTSLRQSREHVAMSCRLDLLAVGAYEREVEAHVRIAQAISCRWVFLTR